ncbi:MAG: hypothetical protein ACLT3Y_03405 [Ruminococcus callidus]
MTAQKRADQAFSKFDRLALSPVWQADGIRHHPGRFSSAVSAEVVGGIVTAVLTSLIGARTGMEHISVHPLLISLICDVLVNAVFCIDDGIVLQHRWL